MNAKRLTLHRIWRKTRETIVKLWLNLAKQKNDKELQNSSFQKSWFIREKKNQNKNNKQRWDTRNLLQDLPPC